MIRSRAFTQKIILLLFCLSAFFSGVGVAGDGPELPPSKYFGFCGTPDTAVSVVQTYIAKLSEQSADTFFIDAIQSVYDELIQESEPANFSAEVTNLIKTLSAFLTMSESDLAQSEVEFLSFFPSLLTFNQTQLGGSLIYSEGTGGNPLYFYKQQAEKRPFFLGHGSQELSEQETVISAGLNNYFSIPETDLSPRSSERLFLLFNLIMTARVHVLFQAESFEKIVLYVSRMKTFFENLHAFLPKTISEDNLEKLLVSFERYTPLFCGYKGFSAEDLLESHKKVLNDTFVFVYRNLVLIKEIFGSNLTIYSFESIDLLIEAIQTAFNISGIKTREITVSYDELKVVATPVTKIISGGATDVKSFLVVASNAKKDYLSFKLDLENSERKRIEQEKERNLKLKASFERRISRNACRLKGIIHGRKTTNLGTKVTRGKERLVYPRPVNEDVEMDTDPSSNG